MADNESGTLVLGRKAFVSTLVAIALNPIGIAVGYVVGKWLQAPKLSVQTVTIDAKTEGLTLPKDLAVILQHVRSNPGMLAGSWRYGRDEQANSRKGVLSAAAAQGLIAAWEDYKQGLDSYKKILEDNIAATEQWTRGSELIVNPISTSSGGLASEAPQTIANRNKSELLGIYRSELRDMQNQFDDLQRLADYLQEHLSNDKRTGEAVIAVGVLNSGDSEGVVYPRAVLRSAAGEIDLTAQPDSTPMYKDGNRGGGGYVVVPPRSFREVALIMDRSTRGDAADNWKKLVQSGRGNDVTVDLRTSGGKLTAKGKLPL